MQGHWCRTAVPCVLGWPKVEAGEPLGSREQEAVPQVSPVGVHEILTMSDGRVSCQTAIVQPRICRSPPEQGPGLG